MIAILQHVEYESPGFILEWLEEHDISYQVFRLFQGDPLPDILPLQGIIIMGGPMNVHEENKFPWLGTEKKFIKKCIKKQKKVFGICLGAQLIASVLNENVYKNPVPEIGWFPVEIFHDELDSQYRKIFPAEFTTLHWHVYTFDIPSKAIRLGKSRYCNNQGFILDDRVIALQFHPEMTEKDIESLINHSKYKLEPGIESIQSEQKIRSTGRYMLQNRKILFDLLDEFFVK